jgi:NitT/TauT family transport system permease protein
MTKSMNPVSALAGLAMFFLLWQVTAWLIHTAILPGPLTVLPVFFRAFAGELGLHFLASAGRVLAAVLLAVVTAVPLGLILGQAPRLDRVFAPLIAILYPIPKIVFLPVIYVLLGITDVSKVLLIALIIFFQILVVVRDEAAGLHPELILSVRSLGAGRRALFRYVYLPAALPAVLTALRVSVGTAIAVLFITEQSLTRHGLGYYIVVETYQVLLYPEMYAGILAMSLLGLAIYFVLFRFEVRLTRHVRLAAG